MRFPRASGILLHPTSLPGAFGIGDFGSEARAFVDFLAEAGQSYWQILPVSPTGYGNSPYSALSAFAGNTLLISPGLLVADGLIDGERLGADRQDNHSHADFGFAYEWKRKTLRDAFSAFSADSDSPLVEEFHYFRRENSWWLDDYALYRAITHDRDHQPWFEWPDELRRSDPEALTFVRSELNREIETEQFSQYLFYRQWLNLKNYANERGIKIIGDIPIFVALDSADVWCNQDKFKLNADGTPRVVAGTPPDSFSSTGQRWGNPIYDWEAMMRDNFGWWTARMAHSLRTLDIVRLDHFIGFVRNWEVPGDQPTAANGQWQDVPGRELFYILRDRIGDLPVIVEDLGEMTPAVESLRDDLGFPGMRILNYAFGGDAASRDLPHSYVQSCVAYTGTHDNDTTAGWYKSAPKHVKDHCKTYLGISGRDIHWGMIRAASASIADTVIIPAQDLLGLGSEARMNKPATTDGNWSWRLREDELNAGLAIQLREVTQLYGR
ncbi:MAG: 4-alpha-glucanotransferase [Pyrinomonadaceae bacterium]